MDMPKIMSGLYSRSLDAIAEQPGDYTDDGLLYCGKCRSPKRMRLRYPPHPKFADGTIVGVRCKCMETERQRREQEDKELERRLFLSELKRNGLQDLNYCEYTFKKDNRHDTKASAACKGYAENWHKMRENKKGLLIYGDIGTGKTYLAACIANALLDQGLAVYMANAIDVINKLQSIDFDDRYEWINELGKKELLIIDDFGIQRRTDYTDEQLYNILDYRLRNGRPIIITTNLTPEKMCNPQTSNGDKDLMYARLFDRLLENCIPIAMLGTSQRIELAQTKRKEYAGLLGIA